jgi:hypothetical protein
MVYCCSPAQSPPCAARHGIQDRIPNAVRITVMILGIIVGWIMLPSLVREFDDFDEKESKSRDHKT